MMKKFNSRNLYQLKTKNNNTYNIKEELSEEVFKKELKNKIFSTQQKVFKNNINHTLSGIEKIIKDKEKTDPLHNSILDHPFINKNTNNTKDSTQPIDQSIEQNILEKQSISGNKKFKRNHSQTLLSNNSFLREEASHSKKDDSILGNIIYAKEMLLHKQKLMNIEQMRNKKREDELLVLQEKPTISRKSKQIVETLPEDSKLPLFKRIYIEQEKRISLVGKLRKYFKEEEKERQEKLEKKNKIYLNKSQTMSSLQINDPEYINNRFDMWREGVMKWHGNKEFKRQIKMENQQNEIIEKESNQPFQPIINNFEGFPSKDPLEDTEKKKEDRIPIYERLYNVYSDQLLKKERLVKDHCPSFVPAINKNLPSYLNGFQAKWKPSRNLSSNYLNEKSTNKSTITKSASMTNLINKSHPISKQGFQRNGGENFIMNNSLIHTYDNKVVFRPNIKNIVNNLIVDDEYNNLNNDESKSQYRSTKSKNKKTYSSNNIETSFQISSKNVLKN